MPRQSQKVDRELKTLDAGDSIVIIEREATKERNAAGHRAWKEQRVLITRSELAKILKLLGLGGNTNELTRGLLVVIGGFVDVFREHTECGRCLICRSRALVEQARKCPELDTDRLLEQGVKAAFIKSSSRRRYETWLKTPRPKAQANK